MVYLQYGCIVFFTIVSVKAVSGVFACLLLVRAVDSLITDQLKLYTVSLSDEFDANRT